MFDSSDVNNAFNTINNTLKNISHTDIQILVIHWGDEYVVPAGRTGGADAQLAGCLRDIIAQHQHMVGRDLEKARHGGDGIAGEVHVGQGLQQHHLVAVHLALSHRP